MTTPPFRCAATRSRSLSRPRPDAFGEQPPARRRQRERSRVARLYVIHGLLTPVYNDLISRPEPRAQSDSTSKADKPAPIRSWESGSGPAPRSRVMRPPATHRATSYGLGRAGDRGPYHVPDDPFDFDRLARAWMYWNGGLLVACDLRTWRPIGNRDPGVGRRNGSALDSARCHSHSGLPS